MKEAPALPNLPGYVVLGESRGVNGFLGIIELSFSMACCSERTCFFWSGDANVLGTIQRINGLKSAEFCRNHFSGRQPEVIWKIYDISDPVLPVILDWDDWRAASEPAETLAGVKNKFRARNVPFIPR